MQQNVQFASDIYKYLKSRMSASALYVLRIRTLFIFVPVPLQRRSLVVDSGGPRPRGCQVMNGKDLQLPKNFVS